MSSADDTTRRPGTREGGTDGRGRGLSEALPAGELLRALTFDETLKLVAGYAPKLLDVGGDAPSPFVTAPGALTLALALLEAANEGAASWWLVRAKTLHARCLVTGSHRVCGTFIESAKQTCRGRS